MESALSNPQVLNSVFGYLNLPSLKNCRRVCQNWGKIVTRQFFNSGSRYCIRVHGVAVDHGVTVDQALTSPADSFITCVDNYSLVDLSDSALVTFLNKINRRAKHLELKDTETLDGRYQFCQMDMPQLESLKIVIIPKSHPGEGSIGDGWVVDNYAKNLSKFIAKAKDLQKLEIYLEDYTPGSFLNLLFGPVRNHFQRTVKQLPLSSLVIKGAIRDQDLKSLRKMKLKLKYLDLCLCDEGYLLKNESPNPLSMVMNDLNTSLETLKLEYKWRHSTVQFQFLTKMTKLSTLSILTPINDNFAVEDILPLLKQTPNLLSFKLVDVRSTGVQVKDFEKLGQVNYHPKLKEFRISSPYKRVLRPGDCLINIFVPKLFPNLRILEIPIYSINELYTCISDLKGMVIEKLKILLYKFGVEVPIGQPWTSEIPTLQTWKKLQKLTLSLEGDGDEPRPTDQFSQLDTLTRPLYGISSLVIASKTLTSFEINYIGTFTEIWLISFLHGLPVLLELKLRGEIVGEDYMPIKRSDFINRIRKDPQIHPYLWVCEGNLHFPPEPNSPEVDKDADDEILSYPEYSSEVNDEDEEDAILSDDVSEVCKIEILSSSSEDDGSEMDDEKVLPVPELDKVLSAPEEGASEVYKIEVFLPDSEDEFIEDSSS